MICLNQGLLFLMSVHLCLHGGNMLHTSFWIAKWCSCITWVYVVWYMGKQIKNKNKIDIVHFADLPFFSEMVLLFSYGLLFNNPHEYLCRPARWCNLDANSILQYESTASGKLDDICEVKKDCLVP